MAVINQYLQTLTYTDPTTANMQLALSAVNDDDGDYEISTPFPITLFGDTFNSVFVGTNGYITFGEGTGTVPDWVYDVVPDSIQSPAILVAGGDDKLRDLWVTNAETSATADTFQLRYVGWYPYDIDEQTVPTNLVYHFTFYKNIPGQIDVQVIQQPVSAYDVEASFDQQFLPNLYVCDSNAFVAYAPNTVGQGFRITAPNAVTSNPYVGTRTTGLEGKLYNGYWNGNVNTLKGLELEGQTEVKTNFGGPVDTIKPDTTWVWTGHLLAPEDNYYSFNGYGDHAMALWFGTSALDVNYSSSNMLASADNYQEFDTRYEKVTFTSYSSATRVFTFSPEVTALMNYLSAGNNFEGYSSVKTSNNGLFDVNIQERSTITGEITADSNVIVIEADDNGEGSYIFVRSPNNKVVYLEAGQLYPIRVVWGHPDYPSGGSLQVRFRMLDGYNRLGNYWYDDNISSTVLSGIAWHEGQSEFQRVANLHGGVANFLRKRLLGHL